MAQVKTWDEIFERMEKIIRNELRELLNSPKVRGAFRKQTEILLKLEEIEKLINMNREEALTKLQEIQDTMNNVGGDVDRLLVIIDGLKNADLPEDVAAKIEEASTLIHGIDDKVEAPPPNP